MAEVGKGFLEEFDEAGISNEARSVVMHLYYFLENVRLQKGIRPFTLFQRVVLSMVFGDIGFSYLPSLMERYKQYTERTHT